MTYAFANHLPIRIRFGDGVVTALPEILAGDGVARPFVVLDPNVAALPAVAGVLGALERAVVAEIEPGEPTLASVDAMGARLAAAGCDGVVAIGGGSVLDTAKGARVVAAQGGPIRRHAWPGDPEPIVPPEIPLVTVPTTAGTGSEVTGGVVMIDPDRRRKVAAPSPWNRAAHALVDPELTHALPPGPTLWGGLDALAQALAAVVVSVSTPIGDGVGLEGTRIAAEALPAVVRDPRDAGARNRMACASLLGGLAMNIAEAGTEHSLGHPLGSVHGLPHGLTIGLVLAEVVDVERRFAPDRYERVADALGAPADDTRDGSRAVRRLREILAAVDCPVLRDCGVTEADVPELVRAARDGWVPVELGPWSDDDIAGAYRAALALERR